MDVAVTDPSALPSARRIVARIVTDAERAADADRAGARVHRLLRSNGRELPVSPTLSALILTALDAAEQSEGRVDLTVGVTTIPLRRAAGRGRPGRIASIPVCAALPHVQPRPATGWRAVRWSETRVAVPAGTALDLTATARARTARLAATRVAEHLGVGALVDVGGDVATAGPAPARGWLVEAGHLGGVTLEVPAHTSLAICRATGVVDPATGRQVTGPWSAVAVAAPDVVAAKTAALAALVTGAGAEECLERRGMAAVFLPATTERHTVDQR